jgi:amino-acid N-acetyltransferase
MSEAPFRHVKPLATSGLPALIDALDHAGLPSDDIGRSGQMFFRLTDDDGLVGFGGLEGEAPDLLLRSLVVAPDRRGQGLGSRLLRRLEQEATMRGCERLHLLTTTAEAFFLRHGFQSADRRAAPSSIAASREFTTLCPASARYLVKELPA